MQIQLEVFGTLRDKLKARLPGGRGSIEVSDGATLDELGVELGITALTNCVVMVNGQVERDRSCKIPAEAKLTIIPPVAGGQSRHNQELGWWRNVVYKPECQNADH